MRLKLKVKVIYGGSTTIYPINKYNIKTITTTFHAIMVTNRTKNTHNNNNNEADIYKINCSSQYIGETCRNVKKCVYKRNKDLIYKNLSNALVAHVNKVNYNFDLKNVTLIK